MRAEVIPVYTSAQVAPLVLPEGKGVYPDMVAYLNRQKLGNLSFKLVYLPRKRLQLRVESGQLDGIVIGMMPHWFNDAAQKKYLWTAPFALDRYVVALPANSAYMPGTKQALSGRTLGMVLGYSYPDLADWLHRQGAIRTDALSDEHNLEKLRLGRVDSVALAESVYRYYRKKHPSDNFHVYVLPTRQTERRFLVPRNMAAIYDQLAPVLRKARDDPEWQRLMLRYE
ncbi:transporter substrate-binding domain-containing protein [Duganella sp.]|uniref:substrate-binding periplasmic protein n=1 Tax=Duganella sp. TaxID=1904440 RepID=UPI0031DD1A33